MPTKTNAQRDVARLKVIGKAGPRSISQPLSPRGSGLPAAASITIYALTIFLGAFLLFQVQLILGKFVLPRFGGGPSVWSTSLLTFQLLLLAGYGYAAVLTQYLPRKTQTRIHLGLLSLSAFTIVVVTLIWRSPILPLTAAASFSSSASPVLQIILLLVGAVGFPCVLLSASSPLLQKWFSEQSAGAAPYRLYALSNLGSMLGLLSYPFVVERGLRLPVQAWMWAAVYIAFLATTAICARRLPDSAASNFGLVPPARDAKNKTVPDQAIAQPKWLWLALSACGSVMLLATTNLICQEVAVIPLLWVLPLSLYLLSFIICFDHARWYRREIFHPLYLICALLSLRMFLHFLEVPARWPLIIFCSTLFAVCMICHGELARLKPEARHLTGFYLMISLGGAIGSAFVVLVAPHLFTRFWEFQIALIGCGVLLAIVLVRDRQSWFYTVRTGKFIFAAAALILVAGSYFYPDALVTREDEGQTVVWRSRNFFGVKTVLRSERGLILRHGRTIHGTQSAAAEVRDEPTMYYRPGSGIGLLLNHFPLRLLGSPLRVGVIGMGAGTLAGYGQPGDSIRFYEIDPDIVGLSQGANPLFTYVKDSRARVEIATGDARIVMQQELARSGSEKFDVLAVDAFSGDAIPVHLLTREAMAIYLKHLRSPGSVIAFHVSNRSIDLRPVIAGLAQEYHLASQEIFVPDVSDWILLSADPGVLEIPSLTGAGHPIELEGSAVLWTDDYSNLSSLIRSW